MRRLLILIYILFINMGLLLSQQETPIVNQQQETPVATKALRDTLQERLKLARRYSTNVRTVDFKLARRHVARMLQLNDSLQLNDADFLAAAGDVEHLAFDYERNKPASGGKMDETACLAAAKQCYLYYQNAYNLYRRFPDRYGKNGQRQQARIAQTAMQYFLLTNGFQVNAGKSFKKGDLKTTLAEFRMTFDGSTGSFLRGAYDADPKKSSGFATFLADSTQCRALYNCATVASALGHLDEALAYYDSLKVRRYAPDKVFRNTIAIHSSRHDTIMLITELMMAIETLPRETWYQKNLLQIYIDRQQWSQAEEVADRCIRVDSTDAHTLCVRGQLYELRGDVQKAMLSYLRSYDIDSTQANVCSYIGRIHFNRAVKVKQQLYDERKFQQIDAQVQPIYEEALPWYLRAYESDVNHHDKSIPTAIREILYSRFTQTRCPNRKELIAQYNEVSRAYGLVPFGK